MTVFIAAEDGAAAVAQLRAFIPLEARKLGRSGSRGIAEVTAKAQFPPRLSVLDGTIAR